MRLALSLSTMSKIDSLQTFINRLEASYHQMRHAFAPPIPFTLGNYVQFRHKEKSDSLLCYLKGVKQVSNFNAAIILFEACICTRS